MSIEGVSLPSEMNSEEVSKLLENPKLLNNISKSLNAETVSEIMKDDSVMAKIAESGGSMDPETIRNIQKMAQSGNAGAMRSMANKSGISMKKARKMEKEMRSHSSREEKVGESYKAVIITDTRKLKEKDVYVKQLKDEITSIIGPKFINEECPRLSVGAFEHKKFVIYYNPEMKRNKRASKLCFNNTKYIGGKILIVAIKDDVTAKDIELIESILE